MLRNSLRVSALLLLVSATQFVGASWAAVVVNRFPGLLVLSDLYYPGWKAQVDGEDVDIERVDYLLRGVPLADGHHTVEFEYAPASWRIGWILSLAGLVGRVVAPAALVEIAAIWAVAGAERMASIRASVVMMTPPVVSA